MICRPTFNCYISFKFDTAFGRFKERAFSKKTIGGYYKCFLLPKTFTSYTLAPSNNSVPISFDAKGVGLRGSSLTFKTCILRCKSWRRKNVVRRKIDRKNRCFFILLSFPKRIREPQLHIFSEENCTQHYAGCQKKFSYWQKF